MQAGAGEPQIQAMVTLLADSFVYEHPRARATIVGKSAYADGLRGFLGSTQRTQIRILSTLVNGGVVVTDQELTFEMQQEGAWKPDSRAQVTVFDVEHGRIVRMVDFWQPRSSSR